MRDSFSSARDSLSAAIRSKTRTGCRFGFDLSLDSKKSCIFKGRFLLPFESILVPSESSADFSGSIGVYPDAPGQASWPRSASFRGIATGAGAEVQRPLADHRQEGADAAGAVCPVSAGSSFNSVTPFASSFRRCVRNSSSWVARPSFRRQKAFFSTVIHVYSV